MPRIFNSKINDKAHHYFDRDQSLNEPVYRAPGAVGPLTVLYHAPFIVQSQEDEIFLAVREGADGRESLATYLVKEKIIGPGGALSIFKAKDFDNKPFFEDRTFITPGYDRGFETARRYLKQILAEKLDSEIVRICERWPEYFIFCSISQIAQYLHYRAAALLVQHEATTGPGAPGAAALGRDVGRALKRLIQRYHHELDAESPILRQAVFKRTLDFTGPHRFKRDEPPDYGGIIAILRQRAEQDAEFAERDEDRTFESDYLSLRFHREPWQRSFFRLRWYRSNQFWSYTLFETFRDHPPEAQQDEMILATSRHLTLGEQRADLLKENYNACIEEYFIALLDFIKTPSAHTEFEPDERLRELGLDYPGKLLAGAYYAFIPIGFLVALVVCPKWSAKHLVKLQPGSEVTPHALALNRLAAENTITAQELDDLLNLLEEIDAPEFSSALRALIGPERDNPPISLEVADLLQLGGKVHLWIGRNKERADKWGRVITRLAIAFWTATGHDKERIKQSKILNRSYHDFISCYVVDRRAIYFTNFLPLPEDRFTRTLYIELSLTGFQRGRLSERLCDIATFRSLCVRDNNRVRAMVRATDEIGHALNDLVIEDEKRSELRRLIFPGSPEKAELNRERRMMEQLDDIQARLDQMNRFVTYGVRGRHLSVRAYFDRIMAIDHDIRQSRITGFPMLADFLERRVARSVNDVARMNELHSELRRRVQDEYNRCRTKFNRIETIHGERTETIITRLTWVLVGLTLVLAWDAIWTLSTAVLKSIKLM